MLNRRLNAARNLPFEIIKHVSSNAPGPVIGTYKARLSTNVLICTARTPCPAHAASSGMFVVALK